MKPGLALAAGKSQPGGNGAPPIKLGAPTDGPCYFSVFIVADQALRCFGGNGGGS